MEHIEMIKLLKYSDFTFKENSNLNNVFKKYYQYLFMKKFIQSLSVIDGYVAEIRPHSKFTTLNLFHKNIKCIIDPYNSAPGGGLANIPSNLPYPTILFRCAIGIDSHIIPDEFFDFTFSISFLEHIGQKECNYNCYPELPPPEVQEKPRNIFCQELYRIMKKGGITFHTIDHAARNLTYFYNFIEAGFKPLDETCQVPTLEEYLNDPDVIRQKQDWIQHDKPMPDQEIKLH
ncbi:MAG: hypothetical protein QXS69_02725 [Candidatus Aenigmatarchaeota archaeon]